mmetsp:Transcript_38066/g.109819  ORF Transcript_38066/g.109819 Transcript_38066/m.109819 type:complete len:248 (+) Transcript_38066:154-897(+)
MMAEARPRAWALGLWRPLLRSSGVKPKSDSASVATMGPPSSALREPSMVLSQAMTALRLSGGTISESSGSLAPAVTQTARRPWRTVRAVYQGKDPTMAGNPQNLKNTSGTPMAKLTSATKTRPWFLEIRAAKSPMWPPKRMPRAHATCPKDVRSPASKSLMPTIWKYMVAKLPALIAMQPKRPCTTRTSKVGLRKKLRRCRASESSFQRPFSSSAARGGSGTSIASAERPPTQTPRRPTKAKARRQP